MRDPLDYLLHFEATDGLGESGGGGGVEAPAPEAAFPAPEAEAPAEGEQPGGEEDGFLTDEDIREMFREESASARQPLEERMAQLEGHFQPEAPAGPQTPELPEWDFTDPAVQQAYTEHTVSQILHPILEALDDRLGSLTQASEMFLNERGEQVAHGAFGEISKEIGEFDVGEATNKARFYMSEGMDPQGAIERAASETRAYEERIAQDAVKAHIASAGRLEEGGEQSAAGASAGEGDKVPTGPDRYRIQLDRSLERMRGSG